MNPQPPILSYGTIGAQFLRELSTNAARFFNSLDQANQKDLLAALDAGTITLDWLLNLADRKGSDMPPPGPTPTQET